MNTKLLFSFLVPFVLLICKVQGEDVVEISAEEDEIITDVSDSSGPKVKIVNGDIRGIVLKSRKGKEYHGFLGIPYGKQPTRFQPAEPVENWEGVKSAVEFGSPCPQTDYVLPEEFLGHENCLFINVYKPKVISNVLPVMVYIHGGAFSGGSGEEYGAKYFMDEEVVLVTLNYRLGALGFLSTEDKVAPGNMGLRDQILALQWVQQNIKSFGGDSARVTIFGGSAGAACVSLLILSPMAKGLFNNAISMSGSALSPWTIAKYPATNAKRLAGFLNCPTDDSEELINCLNTKDVKDIVMSQQKFTKWHTNPSTPFAPTVEYFTPVFKGVNEDSVFLPEEPEALLEEGKFNSVPWIVGVNEDEGLLLHSEVILADKKLTEDLNNDWNRVAPITFLYDEDESLTSDDKDYISKKIRQFYFANEEISKETRKNLTKLYSDRYFFHGARKNIIFHAKQNAVYPYIFSFQGDFSFLGFFGVNDIKGVTHQDDTQYFFNTTSTPEFQSGSESDKFSQKIVKLWVSFAENGSPTGTWEPETQWRSFETSETRGSYPLKWYKLDYYTELLEEYFTERYEFWEDLFKNRNKADKSIPARDEF